MFWIPGYARILGYEIADNCAKQAVHLGFNKYNKCFPRDLLALARSSMGKEWDELWHRPQQIVARHYGS